MWGGLSKPFEIPPSSPWYFSLKSFAAFACVLFRTQLIVYILRNIIQKSLQSISWLRGLKYPQIPPPSILKLYLIYVYNMFIAFPKYWLVCNVIIIWNVKVIAKTERYLDFRACTTSTCWSCYLHAFWLGLLLWHSTRLFHRCKENFTK